jgi:RimJ/RimL family protein N-acetyltransferase
MTATNTFPLDRARPPSRIVYQDGVRYLELRPWSLSDVDALMTAVLDSTPELKGFMPWSHVPPTRESEYTLVARFNADYYAGKEYIFGIFAEDGAVLGGAGLHPRVPLNTRALEVGYWSHSAHAGKGNITLAVQMLIALAFERFDCDRFQVMHDEANAPSRRVVEKCGFVYEATMRNLTQPATEALREGGYLGTARTRMYALCRDDYEALPWLAQVRAHTTLYDALGGVQRLV